jgi:2,4-dienoyl-CoA reductase-like NADH-dependent reductase (Old Yellow Enzyme family)
MSHLFSPLTIRDISFRNRLAISPMCQYSAIDGYANDWHLVHLGARAVGGAGLIIQEATAVSPEGRITAEDLGLWEDGQVEKLMAITHFIRSQGALPGIQLAHAGRKASHLSPWKSGHQVKRADGGWETVAPSAIPFHEGQEAPRALDKAGLEKVVNDFRMATERAVKAGYEVVEIHAAHGYLLHAFLSPLSNQRNDDYGGSFENRVRLLLEVTGAVRSVWPGSLPLFVRLSCSDWAEGGWDLDQTVRLSKILKGLVVDLIDCSSGGAVPHQKIHVGPGYQVPFAEKVRREGGLPTGAVGMITTPEQAEAILQNGQADMVLIARESLRDPQFPLHAAHALGAKVHWPVQYERARPA